MTPTDLVKGKTYNFNDNAEIVYKYQTINHYVFEVDVFGKMQPMYLTHSQVKDCLTEIEQ